jgi:hypothetical protein
MGTGLEFCLRGRKVFVRFGSEILPGRREIWRKLRPKQVVAHFMVQRRERRCHVKTTLWCPAGRARFSLARPGHWGRTHDLEQ